MIAFICLFFPAVLSVWLFERTGKRDLSKKNRLYLFCSNTMFINLLCFVIKRFVLGTAGEPLYSLATDMTPSAAGNYLIMAIPCAVVLGFVEICVRKNVKLTVEDNADAENAKS